MTTFEKILRPLVESGYEVLDERFAETGEVIIRSADPLIPRLADRFVIESGGAVHEVAVYMLTTFHGGWSVTCRIADSDIF